MKEAYRNLSDKEQALLKLPVFFDGYDNFYHPIRESVTNARDILINSEDGLIEVILHDDNQTITIKDNGCGIILDGESNGIPNWEHAFLILFSGSKMSAGGTSGGTNGCGNTIINYSSDFMEITSKRNGKIYHIKFVSGGQIEIPFECLGDTKEHGTEITFKLCNKIYTNTIFNEEEVKGIIERIVVTSPNIKSIFKYKQQEFNFNFNKLSDYLDYKNLDRKINDIVFNEKEYENEYYDIDESKDKIEKTKINLVVNMSNEYNMQYPFLNGIYMPQLSENLVRDGVIVGMKEAINTYIKDNGLYDKKEKQITKQDIIDSISYIVSIESTNVSYTSQTKFSTKKELYLNLLKQYIKDFMQVYCIENKDDIKTFVNQILINKRAREKSEETKKNIKKKLSEKINIFNKIEGLYEAEESDSSKTILCVCEGKSALSSLLSGKRNVHAIFPLKGKILNCLKASPESIFQNEVILKLFRALNCGMEFKNKLNKEFNSFNIDNLRYHDIYIMVDADVDGIGSIFPLLLTMFYKLSPTLIKEGRIHICETPKYEVDFDDREEYFAINDEELEKIKNDLNYIKNKNKITINYIKGLSELSSHAMELCLEEGYKNIKTITIEDFDKAKNTIELFMDSVVEPRKEYILTNYKNIGLIEE
ncbi:toprim domain-containing protein [Clostridium sp. M14]|uniref:toprim domain-containing protein n=1 Tax=Clostridium sp. M14 TaxID=2716311 RepID=UPI0013EE8680|nr:toprim domain-containing protein [Clostridium sp. M14]MBZ9693243.1 hypothetical protein [Clostridium sp. M14]